MPFVLFTRVDTNIGPKKIRQSRSSASRFLRGGALTTGHWMTDRKRLVNAFIITSELSQTEARSTAAGQHTASLKGGKNKCRALLWPFLTKETNVAGF